MYNQISIKHYKSKVLTTSNVKKNINVWLSIFIFLLIAGLAINPQEYIESTLNGLIVFASVILPALLPFFVLTKMLTGLGMVNNICKYFEPLTKFLFKAPAISSYIFLMSIISGYPVGAKLTAECYDQDLITSRQATKITTFTSTSGPLFIIGTVGAGMLLSQTAGLIILLSHILGSVCNGILYRNMYNDKDLSVTALKQKQTDLNTLLAESIYNSIISLLIIGSYVAIFFMLITMLNDYSVFEPIKFILKPLFNFLELDTNILESILNGLVEVTKGCMDVSNLHLNLKLATVICSFLVSFGGFSIYFQAITFLNKCNVNLKFYLLQKFTHAVLAALIASLLVYKLNII